MAKKPKGKPPARQRDSADVVDDEPKPRGKPVTLFPLSFDEAMKRLVRPTGVRVVPKNETAEDGSTERKHKQ